MARFYTLFALVFLCNLPALRAQTYTMSNTTVTTCSGDFYDSGGSGSNYANNENFTMTFSSGNGNRVQVAFSSFVTSSNADVLYAYDGTTINAPLIGTYFGTLTPFSVESSGTSLTFRFVSNTTTNAAGWAGVISCTTPALTAYPLTNGQTVTTCGGVFYDNAGADANYFNNLNSTMTFCPTSSSDYLTFSFPYQLSIASGDSLFVYSGTTTSTAPIAIYTYANPPSNNIGGAISSPVAGECMTFKFVSNATTNDAGWQAFISCSTSPPSYSLNMVGGTIPVCSGFFYDSGGPSANYEDNEARQVTLTSANGNRIQVDFTSFFTPNNSDVLYVYDGNTNNAPMIGAYYGILTPFTVQSTGTSLTFRFISNSVTNNNGWTANISCTTPVLTAYPLTNGQTVTTCGGVFYDNAGADGNYFNNMNSTMTFCPTSSTDYLTFTFPYQFDIASGDSLFVYSGTTTSSAPLAVFTYANPPSNNLGAEISSPVAGACMTFKFVSNATIIDAGWQALISCSSTLPAVYLNMAGGTIPVCSGNFYDSGGPTGNYEDNEVRQVTLTSANGNRIQVDFSSFVTSSNADVLYVYDGNTNNAPMLGAYFGSLTPFSLQSTGTSLTFRFISNSVTNNNGWTANISCTTPVLTAYPLTNGQTVTTCGGVFYDNAGADGNYFNNMNSTMTFCPTSSADYLTFTFPYQFDIASGDSLFVYSGTTTSSAPLAVYTYTNPPSNNLGAAISSPVAGACMTFKFVSNTTTNDAGWQALISCSTTLPPVYLHMAGGTIPVCSGNFYDSGGPSGNYEDNEVRQVTLTSANGNRIQVDFTGFVTSSNADVLYVYDGNTNNAPMLGAYYGTLTPFSVQSTGTSLTFRFISNSVTNNSGWSANISCTTPVLTSYPLTNGQTVTTCGGVFYDNAGADGNYFNNMNSTMTFCPTSSADYLTFTFPYQFDIASGDSLFVYSGTTTSSAPLAVYTYTNPPSNNMGAAISSPVAGACMTFKFVSNATTNDAGWQALISCGTTMPPVSLNMVRGTIPLCNGLFYDSGGSSANYEDNEVRQVTLTSSSGCSLAASFSAFVTSSASDALSVYDGTSTAAPLLGTYSGTLTPFTVQSTGTSLTFRFVSNSVTNNSGWTASMSCPTTTQAIITPAGPVALCAGDSVTLTTTNSATTYLWNTGDTTSSITTDTAGSYFVTITNNIGCTATSAPVSVSVNALPAVPTITQNGAILTSSPATTYQWYLNSVLIPGATGQNYTVLQNGNYTVMITDSNGCSNTSAPYNMNSLDAAAGSIQTALLLVPNPTTGMFRIIAPANQAGSVNIYNIMGERVFSVQTLQHDIDLSTQPNGVYLVEVRNGEQLMMQKLILQR